MGAAVTVAPCVVIYKEREQFMKKRCAWLLMLVLLVSLLMPGMVYATGSSKETEKTEDLEDEETSGETEAETLPVEPAEDAREKLKEAMEKSPLGPDAVIADGVYIDDINVSGMTAEEAIETVLARIDELGQKVLTLTLEGADEVEPIHVPVSELGLRTEGLSEIVMEAVSLGKSGNLIVRYKAEKDLQISNQKYELALNVEENAVKNFVSEKTAGLSVEPVEAELTRVSGGFDVSRSQTGIDVDAEATVTAIMNAMQTWNREDISLAAVAEITQPKRTTELLSQVQDNIGRFSTSINSVSAGKLQNLRTGIRLTDGTLLMPGETWSMHDALAPFTAENGYTKQVAYQNGGYVQEYGGGICQLATTLYNAALLAEVNISERHNHSMTVGYTDPGLDATVNDGGSKDLELTNDFDFPIYIEGSVTSSGKVTYTIWGKETRPSNRTLKFYGEYLSYEETGTVETPDPSLAPGQRVQDQASYPNATARAYKEIYVDGVLEERITLHTDKYKGSPGKVRVGVGEAATEPSESAEAPTDPSAPSSETPATDPAPAPTEAPASAPTDAPAENTAPASEG